MVKGKKKRKETAILKTEHNFLLTYNKRYNSKVKLHPTKLSNFENAK